MQYFLPETRLVLAKLTLTVLQLSFLRGQESVLGNAYGPGPTWCYQEPKCRESTWPKLCLTGMAQSPIDLPEIEKTSCVIKNFPRQTYETDLFSIETNGRTLGLKLLDFEPFFQWQEQTASYGLHSIHFHWGNNDTTGSEHTINSERFGLEMHLIHYRDDFDNIGAALNSGEKNALAIIAVLFQVDPELDENEDLQPITRYLPGVYYPNALSTVSVHFNIGGLIKGNQAYTYQGSLTSPSCDEQVVYLVWKEPTKISPSDLQVFRRVTNPVGKPLVNNFRSIQQLHDRKVQLCEIKFDKPSKSD